MRKRPKLRIGFVFAIKIEFVGCDLSNDLDFLKKKNHNNKKDCNQIHFFQTKQKSRKHHFLIFEIRNKISNSNCNRNDAFLFKQKFLRKKNKENKRDLTI